MLLEEKKVMMQIMPSKDDAATEMLLPYGDRRQTRKRVVTETYPWT